MQPNMNYILYILHKSLSDFICKHSFIYYEREREERERGRRERRERERLRERERERMKERK
jgi:hypothetical protein